MTVSEWFGTAIDGFGREPMPSKIRNRLKQGVTIGHPFPLREENRKLAAHRYAACSSCGPSDTMAR